MAIKFNSKRIREKINRLCSDEPKITVRSGFSPVKFAAMIGLVWCRDCVPPAMRAAYMQEYKITEKELADLAYVLAIMP